MNTRQKKFFYGVKGGCKKFDGRRWSDNKCIRDCVGIASRFHPTGKLEEIHVYGDPVNGNWYWGAVTLPDNSVFKCRVARAIYRENQQRLDKGLIS